MILPNTVYAVLITQNGQTKLDSHLFKNKEKALAYAKNRVKNLAGKHIDIETVTHTYWTAKSLDPTKKNYRLNGRSKRVRGNYSRI